MFYVLATVAPHKWGRASGVAGPVATGLEQTRPIAAGTVAVCRPQEAAPGRRWNASRGPDHKETTLLMAEENPMAHGSNDCLSNEVQDLRDQGSVLIHVLTLYPTYLRLSELIQEVSAGVADFAQRDGIERAVRDLTGVGLLFRSDGLVLPTRAALRFNEILGEGV